MTAGLLRNYFCPKCGAVGEVRWVRAVSQQQYDEAIAKDQEARAKYDADYKAHLEKSGEKKDTLSWYRNYWSPYSYNWWDAAREGLQGEHLSCSCPRCGHSWRDEVLTATGDTPIHDELVISYGR